MGFSSCSTGGYRSTGDSLFHWGVLVLLDESALEEWPACMYLSFPFLSFPFFVLDSTSSTEERGLSYFSFSSLF